MINGSAREEGSEGAFMASILRCLKAVTTKAAGRTRLCAPESANIRLRVPGAAVSVDPTPRTRPRHPLRRMRPSRARRALPAAFEALFRFDALRRADRFDRFESRRRVEAGEPLREGRL